MRVGLGGRGLLTRRPRQPSAGLAAAGHSAVAGGAGAQRRRGGCTARPTELRRLPFLLLPVPEAKLNLSAGVEGWARGWGGVWQGQGARGLSSAQLGRLRRRLARRCPSSPGACLLACNHHPQKRARTSAAAARHGGVSVAHEPQLRQRVLIRNLTQALRPGVRVAGAAHAAHAALVVQRRGAALAGLGGAVGVAKRGGAA